jgi:hypothetical protein
MHIRRCLKGVADTEAIAILDSSLPSDRLRQNATGHTRMPQNVVASATHANRIVAPTLEIRRPSTALLRGPAAFEGKPVMPSAKRNHSKALATPSVMTAYSRRQ